MHTSVVLLVVVFTLTISTAVVADTAPVFDVPRVNGIAIDGKSDDWGDRGFRVEIMADPSGKMRPAPDFDPAFCLGWNEEGLLVLVKVSDSVALEAEDDDSLWRKNCVIPFVAEKPGGANFYGVMVAPGVDPAHPAVRTKFLYVHEKPTEEREFQTEIARTKTANGYVIELMMPWADLGLTPRLGDELGFQLVVADSDSAHDWFTAAWYPSIGTHANSSLMHRIRLAKEPGPPVLARAAGEYEKFREMRVTVTAAGEMIGKRVIVQDDGTSLGTGTFEAEEGRAVAHLTCPMPEPRETKVTLALMVGETQIATVELPDPDVARAKEFIDSEIVFDPYCFSGTKLPDCDFEYPLAVEQLIGPYDINVKYYDADGQPVGLATAPGRYAAVVEIKREDGRVSRRFRTLYRMPEPIEWWRTDVEASIALPEQLGIEPGVAKEQSETLADYLKWGFAHQLGRYPDGAALLAGMSELKDSDAPEGNPRWMDRQWWVGFKRRFYGMDKNFPDAFVCPRPIASEPAPVVREGTLAEAGMKPDGVERIDAVCQEWAENSDEAFAVCIVRHGVIVLHKAYGERDDEPMTLTAKSWMASITKLLSGTLMMELVDQGLVDLDDRVDKHLPALRDIEIETPLTIRHLYTHTNGFWGHWGDDTNDLEEVVADYYTHLDVGKRHEYNGVGYAIGGKIIETISGETIPLFYKKHLLDPLGCPNTDVEGTSGDASSVPLDIAKIGQMLLNRGAYGDMQFFGEETFEKMLPRKLTDLLGPDTELEWGIGTIWFPDKEPSERTFGHGAASAAILRIDLENDVVVVQTRNSAGQNYGKYASMFLKAIMKAIDREST